MGTKPRTLHHQLAGGERRGKRKCLMVFLEGTREGHHQWEVHSHCFKGNIGETFQRFGGSHVYIYMYFFQVHTYHAIFEHNDRVFTSDCEMRRDDVAL